MSADWSFPVWSYEQPPEPASVRIPVWATAIGAYQMIFDDLSGFLKVAALPAIVLGMSLYLGIFQDIGLYRIAAFFVGFLSVQLMSFHWRRRTLLPAEEHDSSFLSCLGPYLLRAYSLAFVVSGLMLVGGILAFYGGEFLYKGDAGNVRSSVLAALLIVSAMALLCLYFVCRVILILPGSAVDADISARASWFLMAGNTWSVVGSVLLVMAPLLLLGFFAVILWSVLWAMSPAFFFGPMGAGLQVLTLTTFFVLGITAVSSVSSIVIRLVRDSLAAQGLILLQTPGQNRPNSAHSNQ